MREEEIMQITPALWGWYAYGQDEQGVEFLTPVVCGALVESSGNASRLVKRPTPERLRSYARGGANRAPGVPGGKHGRQRG